MAPAGGDGPTRESVTLEECGPGNPAGLDPQTVDTLKAAGSDGGARWLYPYEGTVFPRGMIAPTLMWDGAPGDAVAVHITSSLFEYWGCLPVTGPEQLLLPQPVWDQAGDQTLGPQSPFTIEISVLGRDGAVGPLRTQIVIAQATLKGSIFYNSYVSGGASQGSIYRIRPGGEAEVFLGGFGCYGCHSVSANGGRLVSHTGGGVGASYALAPTTAPNPPTLAPAPQPGFSGLSPDGSVYAGTALPAGLVRPQGTPLETLAITTANLYNTDSGAAINGSGLAPGAMMPMFSPDGNRIVFNDVDVNGGRALAVMDYDPAGRAFSNHRAIFTDNGQYPGWPFFLPDSQAVIFARGDNPQFSGGGAGVLAGLGSLFAPASDLYIVDLDTGTATLLARAMGMRSPQDPASYTPFGEADLHQHYYPTVSPVAAGGYYWVFFDSIRNYGNLGENRQLWGSAITVSPEGRYDSDPSHPAFYVTGQQFGTGNHRAFTALDPCKQDGEACETGVDCCSGFCTDGVCGVPVDRCSETDEACETAADCCNPNDLCLNGFCGQVLLE